VKIRLTLAVIAVASLAGAAHGGIYVPPPPGDYEPVWSPDATVLVFGSDRDPHALRVVNPNGSAERPLAIPTTHSFAFSPDWSWIAYVENVLVGPHLIVMHPDGSARRDLGVVQFTNPPAWAPDGRRLAVTTVDGIVVLNVDGTQRTLVAHNAAFPAWSQRGPDRIAYLSVSANDYGASVWAVAPDGSNAARLTPPGEEFYGLPAWSPDGGRIAVSVRRGTAIPPRLAVIDTVLGRIRRLGPAHQIGTYAWSPAGEALAVSGLQSLELVDAYTGRSRLIARYGTDPQWSPNGTGLAFVATGKCLNRTGVYVTDLRPGTLRRITNSCEIRGTDGPDTLVGTELGDDILGFGGNDRLVGVPGVFVGDTLEGGTGNDALVGTQNPDVLDGGPGADTLEGGFSGDIVTGGSGRDVIRGGGGADVVHARDGTRDTVSCGTNTSKTTGPETDVAYVDAVDVASKDCEYVYRPGAMTAPPGRIALTIAVMPNGSKPRIGRRSFTLRCRPAAGTLRNRATACSELMSVRNPFAPVPRDTPCTEIYGGPQQATVVGVYGGKPVRTTFTRTNGCQIARWNRVAFLFPIRVGLT
jgi:Tol biopolymer transport system component